eukprot:GEMP01076241.1.p1 GENE.GEMP01076241.1~~GEMP01076241.1.p1  ORF type:complete len:132 (+),score=8.94 GEMP01076241.1:476-871(+)
MLVPASSFVVFLIVMNFVTGNKLASIKMTLYCVSNVLRARSLAPFLRDPRTRNYHEDSSRNPSELDLLERAVREVSSTGSSNDARHGMQRVYAYVRDLYQRACWRMRMISAYMWQNKMYCIQTSGNKLCSI